MPFNKPNKRRIFLSSNKQEYFKIFSFTQEEDGDIYCHWPKFHETQWIGISNIEGKLDLQIVETPVNSKKLSLHRSGVVKFKQSGDAPDGHRIKGNHLINFKKNQIGARHLFTALVNEPKDLCPNSPFGNRPSDSPIFVDVISPFVIMFFAIPQQTVPVQIHFQPSFDVGYFEDFKKDIGFGSFSLAYHDILWFAYRTKSMKKWPKHMHIFFHDGLLVPLFLETEQIGEKIQKSNVVLQEPTYRLEGNNLLLALPFPELKKT